MLNELAILKHLDHPSIIKIYEVFENETKIYVVQEYLTFYQATVKEESYLNGYMHRAG